MLALADVISHCVMFPADVVEVWWLLVVAGLDNPVFYNDNNRMLLGDAKDVLDQLRASV